MIVYGDPSSQESILARVGRLRESLSALPKDSLDGWREGLIQAGTLEQAAEDAPDVPVAALCRPLTDALAEAFLAAWAGRSTPREGVQALLERLPLSDAPLESRLPEGFAFYSLYPEAYVVATETWLAAQGEPGPVLILGLRSIGTTLSAVVLATLRAKGVPARRLTLRPVGHPFRREAHVDPEAVAGADWILVVDEGPGLSGSSMASVAAAAVRAGAAPERIVFLPGHGNDPGAHASAETRAWWAAVPRFVTPTEALRWRGRTLEETLVEASGGGVERVEELGGGRWRAFAYADEKDWPPVDAPFERRKVLVRRTDGTALLWKFVGLTEPQTTLGFAAAPWIEGRPLNRDDLASDVIRALARHLAATAGPSLPEAEAQAAHDRLAEMLRQNAREAGIPLSPPGERGRGEGMQALDDRFAPHEWRRLAYGRIVKPPRLLGATDHTVVGRQPLAWAVAAAVVEWGLDARQTADLLAEGIEIDLSTFPFYRAAYAAFRLGMTRLCAASADPAEAIRLARAELRYRAALTQAAASPEAFPA